MDQQQQQQDDDEPSSTSSTSTALHTDNVASFLDLQTEFIRRRDAALSGGKQQTSSSGTQQPTPAGSIHRTKNNILAISKEEKRVKQDMCTLRTERIQANEEQWRNEEAQRARQRRILEQKAAIYERMNQGGRVVYEDGREADFLVDFNAKKKESDVEAEQKRRLGKRGRSKEPGDSSSDDDERKRRSAERETRYEEPAPLVIHYDPGEEKGRVFGASHVPLPTMDEDAREAKIQELKTMTEETNRERLKRKQLRLAQRMEELRRLNRLRARMGLPPEELKKGDGDEADPLEGDGAEEDVNLDDIPLPPAPAEAETAPPPAKKKQPLKYGVREWDRGKLGNMRWIEGRREEREEEFAPPKFYR